jgi:hypothetical protein
MIVFDDDDSISERERGVSQDEEMDDNESRQRQGGG